MKKLLLFVIACLIFVVGATPSKAYADSLSDSVIVRLSETHTEDEVVINVDLFKNTGVTDMSLELVYDRDVFTFVEYIRGGQALAKFSLTVTDFSADPTLPLRFFWSANASSEGGVQQVGNDFSEGRLLQIKFRLKDGVQSGNYEIGFKSSGDDKLGVGYVEYTATKKKYAIINKAVITIADNKVGEVEIKDEDLGETAEEVDVLLIIGIAAFVVAAAVAVTILIIKVRRNKRRRENWLEL